jgi:predicted nucleic acid-binding protein
VVEVVIDASVAVKWFLPEPLSDEAESILSLLRSHALRAHAPDLILVEVASVLWKRTRGAERLPKADAAAALTLLRESPLSLERDRDLAAAAYELAALIPCTVYDGFYVALALREDGLLISADAALVGACRTHGLDDYVIGLAEAATLLMS